MSIPDNYSLSTCARSLDELGTSVGLSREPFSDNFNLSTARADSFDLMDPSPERALWHGSLIPSGCGRHPISTQSPADRLSAARELSVLDREAWSLADTYDPGRCRDDPDTWVPFGGHTVSQNEMEEEGLGLKNLRINPDGKSTTIDPSIIMKPFQGDISANLFRRHSSSALEALTADIDTLSEELSGSSFAPHSNAPSSAYAPPDQPRATSESSPQGTEMLDAFQGFESKKPMTVVAGSDFYSPSIKPPTSEGTKECPSRASSAAPLPVSSAAGASPAGTELADSKYLLPMDM